MINIKWIKSNEAVIPVLLAALIAQMYHAGSVFYMLDGETGWFAITRATFYATALESAVFMFAVRGNSRVSWGFAIFSVAINLSYYDAIGVYLWTLDAVPYVLLSTGLPIGIALYSHELDRVDTSPVSYVLEPDTTGTTGTPDETLSLPVSVDVDNMSTTEKRRVQIYGYLLSLRGQPVDSLDKNVMAQKHNVSRKTISRDIDWLVENKNITLNGSIETL